MDVKNFILHSLNESQSALKKAVEGLTQEEIARQPQPGSNHIAFILWHMVWVEDWFFHYLFQRVPQVWELERWAQKLDLPADPRITGFGYTAEQVSGFPSVQLSYLIAYGDAVRSATISYLENLDSAKFDEIVKSRLFGEVSLGDLISHLLVELDQHTGQIAYIRDLVKEQGR